MSRQTFKKSPDAGWCDVSYMYTTHTTLSLLLIFCLGHKNRLTLIQLNIFRMSSVGWLGDGTLSMYLISTAICNGGMEEGLDGGGGGGGVW